MDSEIINTFLAVVDSKSISKAADSLFVSQSTISYRIKELENIIGVTLFDRGAGFRNVILTSAGERFVSFAERYHEISREIESFRHTVPKFEMDIGCVDSVSLYILIDYFDQLAKEFPSAKIRIRTQHTPEIKRMIEDRTLDLGFVLQDFENDRLSSIPIFKEKMYVIRHKTFKSKNALIHPNELLREDELFVGWSPSFTAWHDKHWDSSVPPYLRVDSVPLISIFLRQPRFWAICPESVLPSLLKNENLGLFSMFQSPPDRVTYLLKHKSPAKFTKQNIDLFLENFYSFAAKNTFYFD